MLFLENGQIYTPIEIIRDGSISISADGFIETINSNLTGVGISQKKIDLKGKSLIPGLIDIHVHGGIGVAFGIGEIGPDLENYSRFAASHGVTGFLLSITGPDAGAIVQTIKDYVKILDQKQDWPGAIPLGLHLEGPFLNKEKHGAFNPDWIHNPEVDETRSYLDAGCGWIKQISMAPELPGVEQSAQLLADAGVVISLGHSNTNYENASTALKGMFSHVTHTFNAQSPLHQREPGVVGAVLASDKVTAELIGDSLHVHPAAMKILYRCLGPERIVLVTDAMQGAGMPDGDYDLLNQKVTVKNGKATLPDGTIGGSTGTMEGCIRTMVLEAGVPLQDAVRMASFNPAKVIKVENHKGSIEVGKEADLAILDDAFKVQMTLVKGKVVYSSGGNI